MEGRGRRLKTCCGFSLLASQFIRARLAGPLRKVEAVSIGGIVIKRSHRAFPIPFRLLRVRQPSLNYTKPSHMRQDLHTCVACTDIYNTQQVRHSPCLTLSSRPRLPLEVAAATKGTAALLLEVMRRQLAEKVVNAVMPQV